MNRPHFPLGGRSEAGLTGRGGGLSELFGGQPGLSSPGRPHPTAIENLRRLMSHDLPLPHDRVSELRDRIARGDFLTRRAAEATANRLFDENFDLE